MTKEPLPTLGLALIMDLLCMGCWGGNGKRTLIVIPTLGLAQGPTLHGMLGWNDKRTLLYLLRSVGMEITKGLLLKNYFP